MCNKHVSDHEGSLYLCPDLAPDLPPEAFGVELDPLPPWAREEDAAARADRVIHTYETEARGEMRCADCNAAIDHGGGRCEQHDAPTVRAPALPPDAAALVEACEARAKDAAARCYVGCGPAACVGAYEGQTADEYACDECCGHGQEDGHCRRIERDPQQYAADVVALCALVRAQQGEIANLKAIPYQRSVADQELFESLVAARSRRDTEIAEAITYLSGDAPDIARAHGLAQGIQRHTVLLGETYDRECAGLVGDKAPPLAALVRDARASVGKAAVTRNEYRRDYDPVPGSAIDHIRALEEVDDHVPALCDALEVALAEIDALRDAHARERAGLEGDKAQLAVDLDAARERAHGLANKTAIAIQQRANVEAERDRMKPVVEAAEIWRQGGDRGELKAAVDAYSDGQSATTERSDLRGLAEREAQ